LTGFLLQCICYTGERVSFGYGIIVQFVIASPAVQQDVAI